MGNGLGDVVARLRHAAAVGTHGTLADGELLERFAASADGAAFAVLVERHGPMVLGVCRRALASCHDAEDACQAVFLVLARKAASLRRTVALGSWLHGVARRIAANARRDAALRKAREAGAAAPAPADPAAEATWREVQAVLDEELGRLPDRYRAALVLCYLECLTRDEAAARLGVTPGALHGCLERGRDLLRQRLSRRGLALSAVLTAAGLSQAAVMPPLLAASTAHAAALFAAGESLADAVGANVLALTHEVLTTMTLTKVKLCMAVVFTALIGGAFLPLVTAQGPKPPATPAAAKGESDEDFIRRVSKDLREADPTPAEVHFFVASKEPKKRQQLIDLFIKERQERKTADEAREKVQRLYERAVTYRYREVLDLVGKKMLPDPQALKKDFFKGLGVARTKEDVTKVTRAYINGLMDFAKAHPDSPEAPEAVRQVVLLYESLGEMDKAEAWRRNLLRGEKGEKSKDPKPVAPGR
jgi:RNA polymerase sigma factor (sigma-70 family)